MCGVATQGDINKNEWVLDFKLSYSADGNTWTTYKDGDGDEVVRFSFIYPKQDSGFHPSDVQPNPKSHSDQSQK